MAVLKNKRNSTLQAIREAASKEEVELQRELKEKRDKLESEISVLEEDKLKLEEEAQELSRDISNQEVAKQTLIDSIDGLKKTQKSLQLELKDYERQIKQHEERLSELNSELETLKSSISFLENAEKESEELLKAVKTEIKETEDKNITLIQGFTGKKAQITQEILELDNQLTKKLQLLREISGKDKEMRESLAKKQLELEKREEVIKRRESIVSVGEQKIKNNVSMLKL